MDLPLLLRPGVYQKAISECPCVAAVPTHRNHSRRAKVFTVAVRDIFWPEAGVCMPARLISRYGN